MAMRTECKFYESRTYPSGDAVRMCRLDLAPQAPWHCPNGCARFELRLSDGGWQPGTLANSLPPPEPECLDDQSVALLDRAEDIVNAAGPEIIASVADERRAAGDLRHSSTRRKWWPFGRS